MDNANRDHGRQANTQTARAVLSLRDMIVGGQLEPDTRYTETHLAELLSMSRTPIRAALQKLTDEGLLTPMPAGGYVLRQFLPQEIGEAIEIRGMLEGLCARLVAERGADPATMDRMTDIVTRIDTVLNAPDFGQPAMVAYSRLNAELHQTLVAATGSALLAQEVARANARPFASASALVGTHQPGRAARDHLLIGQDQHHSLIEAIRDRQGGRAESIMREHARLSRRNLDRAVAANRPIDHIRGASLIIQPDEETG